MTEAIADRALGRASGRVLPWLGAVVVGLLLGGASLLGDASGVRVLNGLANAAGPWLLAAFIAGRFQHDVRAGGLAGAAALVVAVATYYLGIGVIWGSERAYAGPLIVLWVVAAIVGGTIFGGAGATWTAATGRRRAIAAALPIAALFAEAAHRLIQIDPSTGFDPSGTYPQVMFAEAIAAVALLWLMARDGRTDRSIGLLATAALSLAGLIALLAVESIARTLASL